MISFIQVDLVAKSGVAHVYKKLLSYILCVFEYNILSHKIFEIYSKFVDFFMFI